MKYIISTLILTFLYVYSYSQISEIQNGDIKYEFDISDWLVPNPEEVTKSMENDKLMAQYKDYDLVALYSSSDSVLLAYPFILIVNKKSEVEIPSLDEIERGMGAKSISIKDYDKFELNDFLKDFDFKTPLLIKEKELLIMESASQYDENNVVKSRKALIMRKNRIVLVQIFYLENKDEKYLEAFNKIAETLEY